MAIRTTQANPASSMIIDITPQNPSWTLLVRAVAVSPVSTWTNNKGTGKICTALLQDKAGSTIRATGFNATAVRMGATMKENAVSHSVNELNPMINH